MRLNDLIMIFSLPVFLWFPQLTKAAVSLEVGDRVLAEGHFHRKCSAKVTAIPQLGFAHLTFDRAGCGDTAQPYAVSRLQKLAYVEGTKDLRQGDTVMLNGFLSGKCSARVKEISLSGYVAVDLDSDFCADSATLRKASELTRVSYVNQAQHRSQKFELGQKVSTKGIHHDDTCVGQITKLTDNGLATINFEALTCAYAGKLYSLDQLRPVHAPVAKKHVSGAAIFHRIMREISSAKKGGKQAHL